jgi:MoaA/NifB/PqqE/SkfB family radical SAM enzyme
MATLREALKNYVRGYTKTAVFALTTQCDCKCIMCDMHRKTPQYISFEDAKIVLNFLKRNKFLIAYITGGEPTLHPNITDIVEYADKLGLITTMTTNGTSSKNLIKRLKTAGLYLLSISLDHWDPHICEKIRNYKNILAKQLDIITYSKKIGLKIYALAFLNPFLVDDGVEKLVNYTNNLGIPLGFCYPTKCETNSYGLGGVLSQEESSRGIDRSVKKILQLKKKKSSIANLWVYMEDVMNFQAGKKPLFYCKGGEDVVYIDWHGDVYPCFLKPKMFNILRDKPNFLRNVQCDDCLINCFREPSILPQFIHSPKLLFREILYSYSNKGIYA